MKDDFRCEDNAALIGFLYDDCDADEQARITAHLAVCTTCAGELAALSATREHLSAWTPPDAQLGFRMNHGDDRARSAAWWSRPMPAWAQLAAALVIFAAGTAVGVGTAGRTSASGVDPVVAASTRSELLRFEQRLQQVEARPAIPVTQLQLDDKTRHAILARVESQIRDSEERLSVQLATRTIELLQDGDQRAHELIQRALVDDPSNRPMTFKLTALGAQKGDE